MSREDDILHAAEELFYARGYHAVTVDEIGEAAGVYGPAIYRNFASKEELLTTLFDRAIDELNAKLGELPADPGARLDRLIDVHVGFLLEHHKLASVWVREDRGLPRSRARRHHTRSRRYVDRWVACLTELYPDADAGVVTTTTYTVLGGINSLGAWRREALRAPDPPAFLAHFFRASIVAALGPMAVAGAA